MTSVPLPLKFLRGRFDEMEKIYETWIDDENKVFILILRVRVSVDKLLATPGRPFVFACYVGGESFGEKIDPEISGTWLTRRCGFLGT